MGTREILIPVNSLGGLYLEGNIMNRKKKLNDALNKKLKKMNAKLRVNNKPKYIAKAERENVVLTQSQSQD